MTGLFGYSSDGMGKLSREIMIKQDSCNPWREMIFEDKVFVIVKKDPRIDRKLLAAQHSVSLLSWAVNIGTAQGSWFVRGPQHHTEYRHCAAAPRSNTVSGARFTLASNGGTPCALLAHSS